MIQRRVLLNGGGSYFSRPKTKLKFIPTGCLPLDLALGGGWAEGRIANIVGDKSSGKTLLCIEAVANFAQKYPKGDIFYRECEAAFDPDYASALGMPISRVEFGEPMETVEELFNDLNTLVKRKASRPVLYIVDSLDSLSDAAELERSMDQGTYGTNKARNMSQMFRRLCRQMSSAQITLMIVSQVRSKIGISFGRSTTRSGGRALDFYASQVLYLAHTGTISKTVKGVKRPIGVKVKAKVDKCKVGLPLRESAFSIMFGYGIDDKEACLAWLKEIKHPVNENLPVGELHKIVSKTWYEVESSFLPKRKKYSENTTSPI